MTKLTTERLEKLQDDLLQFQDSYSDPADKENYDIFVDALHVIDEFKIAKEKILAYEQAAKNPADLKTLVISEIVDFYAGFESPGEPETVDEAQRQIIGRIEKVFGLAAPVLPKQPELVDLSQQVEILNRILNWILKELPVPTQKASAMAIRLSSVIDIISDLEIPSPAQPAIPEHREYISFDALMAAVSEVTGAKSEFDATPEKCYQAVPFMNFNSLSRIVEMFRKAQPVSEPYKLPDGWKMVPIEPTPKMLVAAMGMFTAEELAESWGDMIEAAPDPSTGAEIDG